MDTTAFINETLEGRRLLTHPFYQRWEAGELGEGELALYASQYRHFEAFLPTYLDELGRGLTGPAHELVQRNLADEVAEPTHLSLFDAFAASVDAPSATPSPAMDALLATYRELLADSPEAALAGLAAYEVQGADIAASKGEGLRRHYGLDSTGTAFWDVHAELESDHATWTADALNDVDRDVVAHGVNAIAQAWWSFLDEREALAA